MYVYCKQTRKECIMLNLNLYLSIPILLVLFNFTNSFGQTEVNYFESGRSKYKNEDYTGSIQDHTKAIDMKPDYAVAYYNRGLSKAALDNHKEAISDFNMSIELTLITYAKEYKDEIIEDATDGIEISLRNELKDIKMLILAYQYVSRGISKFRIQDFKGAIADYDKAINSDSNHIDAYFERGFTKNKNKDYPGAYLDFDKAIKLDSNFIDAYNGRGYCKTQLLNYEGALSDYNKSIELDPKYDISYYERATVKICLSDFKGAIEDYDKAIELNPNYGDAYFGRGCVKELLNDIDGACSDLNISKSIGGEYIETIQEEIDKNCK